MLHIPVASFGSRGQPGGQQGYALWEHWVWVHHNVAHCNHCAHHAPSCMLSLHGSCAVALNALRSDGVHSLLGIDPRTRHA